MSKRMGNGIAVLLAATFLVGCGGIKSDSIKKENKKETVKEASREYEGATETEEYEGATEPEEYAGDAELEGFRELTEEECKFFTEMVQEMDTYGFLMSEYTGPTEVSLAEVFYSGAGLSEEMSEEEKEAYRKACNQEEIYTDCMKIKKSDAEMLIRRKLGCEPEEFDFSQIGVYLPEYDAYYHECGDTNYTQYTCTRGLANGNVFTLDFQADIEYTDSSVRTVMEKKDGEYLFISNQNLNE